MILKVGFYAKFLDTTGRYSGVLQSGFFQGIDGANRLVFIGVNGHMAINANNTLWDQFGKVYTLVEFNGKKLAVK